MSTTMLIIEFCSGGITNCQDESQLYSKNCHGIRLTISMAILSHEIPLFNIQPQLISRREGRKNIREDLQFKW